MSIQDRIFKIKDTLPGHVRLVAVSKTKPVEIVMQAYEGGHRVFGENKAQDLIAKQALLPQDIQWHFIGHLQTNKVKYLVPFISMIESVDTLKLLREINKQATKIDRTIDCLLQFHIASEDTKFGLDMDEAVEILESEDYAGMAHINICGVMGMATYTEDEQILREEFSRLRSYFEQLKERYFSDAPGFREISMGMSGDYAIAIEEGSTNVRVGTAIFGERR